MLGEERHRAEAVARAPARQGRAVASLVGLPAWQVQEYRHRFIQHKEWEARERQVDKVLGPGQIYDRFRKV